VSRENAKMMEEWLEEHQPPKNPCGRCQGNSLQYLSNLSNLYESRKQGRLLLGLNHCLNLVELCPHHRFLHVLAVQMGQELQMTIGTRS